MNRGKQDDQRVNDDFTTFAVLNFPYAELST